MSMQKPPRDETVDGFKDRLRRTALAIPERVIKKMVAGIQKRAQGIYDNEGGHLPRD